MGSRYARGSSSRVEQQSAERDSATIKKKRGIVQIETNGIGWIDYFNFEVGPTLRVAAGSYT